MCKRLGPVWVRRSKYFINSQSSLGYGKCDYEKRDYGNRDNGERDHGNMKYYYGNSDVLQSHACMSSLFYGSKSAKQSPGDLQIKNHS